MDSEFYDKNKLNEEERISNFIKAQKHSTNLNNDEKTKEM